MSKVKTLKPNVQNLGSSASRRAGSIPVIRTLLESRSMSGFQCFGEVQFKATHQKIDNQIDNQLTSIIARLNYTKPSLFIPKINGRATVAKGKRWFIYYRYNGKRVYHYGDLSKFDTVAERRRVGNALVAAYTEALRRGFNPLLKKMETTASFATVIDSLESALANKKPTLKQSTYDFYYNALERFKKWAIKKMLAGSPVESITRSQIADYLNFLRHEGNNKTSVNNNKRALSSLFGKLVADFILEVNPVSNITTEKSTPLKNRPFTPNQIKLIVDYCNAKNPYLLDFIKFMVYGLLRPREVIRIKAGSIQENLIFLDTKKMQATITIINLLEPTVSKLLNESTTPQDTLLTSFGIPQIWEIAEKSKVNHFIRQFQNVKKALHLGSEYGLYSFRHSAIYSLYKSFEKDKLDHTAIIAKMLPITRHKSEKELSAYLREVGAMLPVDYGARFDFDL